MVALRSRLITELNHLFVIMKDMNSVIIYRKKMTITQYRPCDIVRQRQVRRSMGVDFGPHAPTPGRGLYHGGDTESRVANPES